MRGIIFSIFAAATIFGLLGQLYEFVDYRTSAYYKFTKIPKWKLTRRNGMLCEWRTYSVLRKLERQGWKFLFDLYIPKAGGGTTQIDMIAVGPHGVIVVEVKDFAGSIYGHEFQKYWIQEKTYVKNPQEQRKTFYNPIMQNAGHIRNLSVLLGEEIPIKSLIVFSEKSEKGDLHVAGWRDTNDVQVTSRTKTLLTFRNLTASSQNSLTPDTIKRVYKLLAQYAHTSKEVKQKHINSFSAS